jgi:hypothetical protein
MKFSLSSERTELFFLRKVNVLKYALLRMRLPKYILYQQPMRLSSQWALKKQAVYVR